MANAPLDTACAWSFLIRVSPMGLQSRIYDAGCTHQVTGHVLRGMEGQQAVTIVLGATGCHVANAGVWLTERLQ